MSANDKTCQITTVRVMQTLDTCLVESTVQVVNNYTNT